MPIEEFLEMVKPKNKVSVDGETFQDVNPEAEQRHTGGWHVGIGVGAGGESVKKAFKGRFFKEGPWKSITISKEF